VDSRMGQFLGNKNAYFDVLADPLYKYLLALNYTGAVLLWEWRDLKFSLTECFNGHAGTVKALEWNHSGHFLVSVSKDQTTRVIAKHINTGRYHEVSRAQVHGYDINAVTVLKVRENTLDVIACGADEKVIRILEPPACFANYLNTFTQANLHLYFPTLEEEKKYITSKPGDEVLLY
jgi:elongator complex protein 2